MPSCRRATVSLLLLPVPCASRLAVPRSVAHTLVCPACPVQQGQLPRLHLPQLVAALGILDPLLDHFPGRNLVGKKEY